MDLDYEANRYRKEGVLTTPVDIATCDHGTGSAGNVCPDFDQMYQDFPYTTEMASTGRWEFSVIPKPGAAYGESKGKVEVRTSTGTILSDIEFNSYGQVGGSLPKVGLKPTDKPMVAGQTYRITITATKATVSFKIVYSKSPTDVVCGGLRLSKTTINDGSGGTSKDIVTTYQYKSKSSPTVSSGVLYRTPVYGFSINRWSALFSAYSMTPLSSFNGYHIGYERVITDKNGIGQQEVLYNIEGSTTTPSAFPVVPATYSVTDGTPKETNLYAAGGATPVSKTTVSRYSGDNYQTFGNSDASGYVYAARRLDVSEGGSPKEIKYYSKYTIRTSVYRPSSITSTVDGVTSVTNYTYGTTVLPAREVKITNSNTQEVRTTTTYYSGEHTNAVLLDKFKKYNILYLPYKAEERLGSTVIGGSETIFEFFSSTGTSPSSSPSGKIDIPRAHEFRQLEKSYDASGNLIGSTTPQTVQTILEYDPRGIPTLVQEPGWTTTRLTYNGKKLLEKRVFNGREESYTYDGLRVETATAADGTTTSYTYDLVGRLKTETDVCNNIVTTYTYHFTTGGTDKNYTEVKVDYPKPSGNSALDIVETRTYLDGLGRPIQTVAKKQGPAATEDIITAQEYDKYGRVYRTYEPYKYTNNSGAYQTPSTSWGYTQTTYESSPLSRVKTVTPPSWMATTYDYGSNTSTDAVKDLSGTNTYGAGTLAKTTVTDGNGNKLITFTDKIGRKVLSRRTNSSDATSARLDTYYLYDGKGRLSKVLPPGATTSTTKLIYIYLYDGKDQIIEKTVPGSEKEEFKYNSRQLLAASRDGKLRTSNKWYVHTYDSFGRELKGGLFNGSLPTDLNAITPSEVLSEVGYGTQVYDWDKVTLIKTKILGSSSDYLVTNSVYTSCGVLKQQTGNNHLLLSPTNGELTTYTYDGGGNVVGSVYTHKVPSQTHTISSASFYDYAGRPTGNDFKVDNGSNRRVHQLVYDQRGNVTTKYQGGTGLSGALAYLQKVDYTYLPNGLLQGININTSTGKLSGSQVGLPASGTAATMPSPATPSSTSYDDRDLFYLELYRNTQATGIPTTTFPARKNGDIVAVASQVRGRQQQVWALSYDAYDRMRTTSFYQRETRTSTPSIYSHYDEDVTSYDARGNILELDRYDNILAAGKYTKTWIDDLEYTYEAGSNRLRDIEEDQGTAAQGYGQSADYFQYDENGNVKYDPGRKITLTYNHLNVPERITWTDGRKIEMTYDAAGTLLKRKTIAANGNTVEERHYVGGIEYLKNGSSYVLESVYHAEGRILFTGTSQEWQYALTDHLGNTRLVYADRNGNGIVEVEVPSEIVQEEHYFPFGMKMSGPWMGGAAGAKTKYQYNGIEHVDAFALNVNMAHYRTLDPTIGRWWGVDPYAESFLTMSPYVAMGNSPTFYADPGGGLIDPVTLTTVVVTAAKSGVGAKIALAASQLALATTTAWAATSLGGGIGGCPTCAYTVDLPTITVTASRSGMYDQSAERYGFNGSLSEWQQMYGHPGWSYSQEVNLWSTLYSARHDAHVSAQDAIERARIAVERMKSFAFWFSTEATVLTPSFGTPNLPTAKSFSFNSPIKGRVSTPQVTTNRINGKDFENHVAEIFESQGYGTRLQVYKPTPFGPRHIDIEVSLRGRVLGGVETKFGPYAKYGVEQRAKDFYLWRVQGYRVNVIRGGHIP